ncbi:DUF2220 domain-containing protein [Ruania zhangjianzhongii]|uniref:DUF2220 domain-containing protein n=1 Tax=Ruania zhangjianzhongii TaxID=2603206 RepID=UPI001F28AF8D|nr:DUF2220 domain-containing protein [Ruania zhangjianzhongii]
MLRHRFGQCRRPHTPCPVGSSGWRREGRRDDRGAAGATSRLAVLADSPIRYWGDLDTHGFAILDRLRARLPRADSVLMDRDTLLAHRDRWGREPKPTHAALTRLREDEAALYADLVSDRFDAQVRLEQERIDWDWAIERLED